MVMKSGRAHLCLPRAEEPERWEVNEGSGEEQVGAVTRQGRNGGGAGGEAGEKIEKQGGERGWFENVIFLPALA